jgi:hypothetical protein
MRSQCVVLRSADRSQEHRVGFETSIERLLGKRVTAVFNGGSTDQPCCELEVVAANIGYRSENLYCLGRDFRADSVARKNCDS